MKISFEKVDARGLELELPHAQRASLREADGLRGLLDAEGDRLTITNAGAERLGVAALRLVFGDLELATGSGLDLDGVSLAVERVGARLALDLQANARASALRIAIHATVVEGSARLEGAKLFVRDAEGTLSADRVVIESFVLRLGRVELRAEALTGGTVEIGWGASGFRLTAATLEAPTLRIDAGAVRAALAGVKVGRLAVSTTAITIGDVAADKLRVAVTLDPPAPRRSQAPGRTSKAPPAPPRSQAPAEPMVDLATLDGLGGDVDVDVAVDIRIPILGHRRATHRLRVPLEGGSLDFRALENNLAKLENALLDFALRDGALVLERVNPLFPKRGYGKPVVTWPLGADDVALGERDRVRLAVLPGYQLAGGDDRDDGDEGRAVEDGAPGEKSAVGLERLDLLGIDVRLVLAPKTPIERGRIRARSASAIEVKGELHFAESTGSAEGPPPAGEIQASVSELALSIHDLPAGSAHVDVREVSFAEIAPLLVGFAGFRPTSLALDGAGIAVNGVAVRLQATTEANANV